MSNTAQEFDLTFYLQLIRKWIVPVIIVAGIAGAGGYWFQSNQPPTYEARSLLSIGGFLSTANPEYNEVRIGMELVDTYARLLTTTDVLNGTIDALGLEMTPGQLRQMVSSDIVNNTSLMVIIVEMSNPETAAAVANELAKQLELNTPSNLTPELQNQIRVAQQQITILEDRLAEALDNLALVEERIQNPGPLDDPDQLQQQRNDLNTQITQITTNIAQFSETITRIEQRSNSISLVDPARAPGGTSNTSPIFIAALAAVGAGGLVGGLAFVYEYVSHNQVTLRTVEQVRQYVDMPVRGSLLRMKSRSADTPGNLITRLKPSSPVLESYRLLRTNLLHTQSDDTARLFLLASPVRDPGKSAVTTNLALTIAAAGMKVLLIDADLRRPQISRLLRVEAENGLSDLLKAKPEIMNDEGRMDQMLKQTIMHLTDYNVHVILSGQDVMDPTALLETGALHRWLTFMQHNYGFDVILLDTPPVLTTSDASVLAATLDAQLLLMVHYDKTTPDTALLAKEQIVQVGGKMAGVVMHQVTRRDWVPRQ